MTDLVRTVRSRSVGLDLVLGGGPRLLRRVPGSSAESATVLVRGGPGTGKSVFAADFAVRMAHALSGDVLYACIEILPSEVIAQRQGFVGFDASDVIDLADPDARRSASESPCLVVGMSEMDTTASDAGGAPDVGRMILELMRLAIARGSRPRVVVLDSLSDGYGLGSRVPRPTVDGVCKLALEQGWVLVLVEEIAELIPSPWSFAVDTVLSLEVTPAGRREVRVTKHRFGPCQPGPHRLLVEPEGVRVIPSFAAYRDAVRDLELPPPTTGRSLSVPLASPAKSSVFAVPDGEGRLIMVWNEEPKTSLVALTGEIGATNVDGSESAARVTLGLHESLTSSVELPPEGFNVRTLHQMIDGEEWLEAALSRFSAIPALARVRIGPTDRLAAYAEAESLRTAISLLASILRRRGLLTVIYGADARAVLRAGIADQGWSVSEVNVPAGQLKVTPVWPSTTAESFLAAVP